MITTVSVWIMVVVMNFGANSAYSYSIQYPTIEMCKKEANKRTAADKAQSRLGFSKNKYFCEKSSDVVYIPK